MSLKLHLLCAASLAVLPAPTVAQDSIAGIGPTGGIQRVQGGVQFTEGPAWDGQGRLYFSDIPANRIYRLEENGKIDVYLEPSHHANGLMLDGQGRILACQMDGQVVSIDAETKESRVVAGEYMGKRFNAPNELYWDYPVVHGNQQSMHFAFLFNWAGAPWLTQHWSREVLQRYYGYGTGDAYLGDEDQGQMSAWFVMAALGLFQMDGGCRVEPVYEIGSPLYPRVVLDLGGRYGRGDRFIITAENVSRRNRFVQSAQLNGRPLARWWFSSHELLQGGELVLTMGPEPNPDWGVGTSPPAP